MKDKIFSVLQRVGRSFMLPIAILPVAGLLLGIGSSFTNATTIETYGLTSLLGNGTILHAQSHQSGIPMIRPLVMEYPKDPIAKTQNLSYMLGDALLISPGFDRDEYELYLPEGRWQDIESKEVYEGMTFVHIENKAFADGGTSLRVFQKEGTSIPLFAQKEVLHVPAQLWKQEDLEFMTFQKKDVD